MTKILTIDDKEDNLFVTTALLDSVMPGAQVLTAQNGADGFAAARKERPDVILLDILMPGMDGYQVCKLLKTHVDTRAIPVIVLTSSGTETDVRVKALETGADAFLGKPVGEAELAAQVNAMLRIKTTQDRHLREKSALKEAVTKKNGQLKEEINERKQVQESLHETEERYKALFDTAGDAIYIHDMVGRFVDFNRVAHERLGYSKYDMEQLTLRDITSAEFHDSYPRCVKELKKNGHMFLETEHRHADGSVIRVELNCKLIEFSGRTAVLSIARDITRRCEMEAKLLQAQKMEAVGTLAGGIAHDFNNILGVIYGYAELARHSVRPQAIEKIDNILTAAERARNLVRRILTFSRRTEQEVRPVEMVPVVEEALKLLRASMPSTIDIRHDLPEYPGIVLADPTQLQQIVMNLCVNAGHAMKGKEGVLTVSVEKGRMEEGFPVGSELKPGTYLKLSVEDNGCGMSPDVVNRVFDPFFTTKEPGEGTGLGLSIVHGIVKKLDGHISVYSEPGEGTRFDVLLPVLVDTAVPSPEEFGPPSRGDEHILFVDDEDALVKVGSEILEGLGYKVTGRVGSIEALACFDKNPGRFDLVISDLTMPNLTGVQLAKEITRTRAGTPFILCSGFSNQMTPETLEAAGIKKVVLKPLITRELATIVRGVLDEADHHAAVPVPGGPGVNNEMAG